MAKQKQKLTAQEKAVKEHRQLDFMTILIKGKQKRVKRPATIESIPVDEFILLNADPIWLHQHGEWHGLEPILNISILTNRAKRERRNASACASHS